MISKVYQNRYGADYWFEPLDNGAYKFCMSETEMAHCRMGADASGDFTNLSFFDPSGGPFISVGSRLEFGTVNKITVGDTGIVVHVN